jgi:Rod binding domain-containing protein
VAIGGADLTSKFALDVQSVNQLKLDAKQSSPEALKAAAQQFEAVFMNMLMKSMREATPQDGMFDSEQTRMYTSMLDQQMSQHMASRGIGLADVMVRQLSGAIASPPPGDGATPEVGSVAQGLLQRLVARGMPHKGTPIHCALQSRTAGWSRMPQHMLNPSFSACCRTPRRRVPAAGFLPSS